MHQARSNTDSDCAASGREHLFVEVHDAVQHAHEDISRVSLELSRRSVENTPMSGQLRLHARPDPDKLV